VTFKPVEPEKPPKWERLREMLSRLRQQFGTHDLPDPPPDTQPPALPGDDDDGFRRKLPLLLRLFRAEPDLERVDESTGNRELPPRPSTTKPLYPHFFDLGHEVAYACVPLSVLAWLRPRQIGIVVLAATEIVFAIFGNAQAAVGAALVGAILSLGLIRGPQEYRPVREVRRIFRRKDSDDPRKFGVSRGFILFFLVTALVVVVGKLGQLWLIPLVLVYAFCGWEYVVSYWFVHVLDMRPDRFFWSRGVFSTESDEVGSEDVITVQEHRYAWARLLNWDIGYFILVTTEGRDDVHVPFAADYFGVQELCHGVDRLGGQKVQQETQTLILRWNMGFDVPDEEVDKVFGQGTAARWRREGYRPGGGPDTWPGGG